MTIDDLFDEIGIANGPWEAHGTEFGCQVHFPGNEEAILNKPTSSLVGHCRDMLKALINALYEYGKDHSDWPQWTGEIMLVIENQLDLSWSWIKSKLESG